MASSYTAPATLQKFQQLALIVGVVFVVLLAIGAFVDRDQFFQSYIFSFTFWLGIPIGALALLMLQHVSGGGWGLVIRRVLEAATRTLPLMVVLFVPLILGAHSLYPWAHSDELAKHPELLEKARNYLNLPFFTARAAVYFAIWLTLVYLLNHWSLEQDRTADQAFTKRMRVLSGPGMVLLILTVTFSSIDWYMSLDPEWYSTIYGFIFVASWTMTALAFVIAVMALLWKYKSMHQVLAPGHFNDLGNLLLTLVMLWAYFAFSQYLIIWSGNLPEEISWYLPRTRGGWGVIVLLVVIFHFALPFLSLLSRSVKRNPNNLLILAVGILLMRLFDLLWMLRPTVTAEHHLSWMDIVAPLGIGGLWLSLFIWELARRPLIPINDPQYETVLEQAHAAH